VRTSPTPADGINSRRCPVKWRKQILCRSVVDERVRMHGYVELCLFQTRSYLYGDFGV
jgi:hypothetical protein